MAVFIGSTPNSETKDVILAKRILKGELDTEGSVEAVQSIFGENTFLFNRGRESIYFFLKLLNLNCDDEVVTQAFTCVAVVAPVLWANCKPIYVDLKKNSFNMDIDLLEKSITKRTRAVIVQHTFGEFVNTERVREIVDKINSSREERNKIYILEDSAHFFAPNYDKLGLGKYSDALMFSFSQDKAISSTNGSALLVKTKELQEEAQKKYEDVKHSNIEDDKYCARYIILWNHIKENYFKSIPLFKRITLGKIYLMVFRFLGLIKKQASLKTFLKPEPTKMGEIQATLLLSQIKRAGIFNDRREEIVKKYDENLNEDFKFDSRNKTLLRYPILLENREEIRRRLSNNGIVSGIWYSSPVFPLNVTEHNNVSQYILGTCRLAERYSKKVLNLPTNIGMDDEDVKLVIDIVNKFGVPYKNES